MSPLHVWINGRLVPEDKAQIPVADSAYLYGHGVFETLRASSGQVRFLKDHLGRLRRNARLLELKLPYSDSCLQRELQKILGKNGLREATIRVTLSENVSGHQLVIMAKPFVPYPRTCYVKGGKLILIQSVKADASTIASVKTTSYLTKILARKEIRKRRAVEGVLLNHEGCVTEGGSSNLFIVKNGVLLTPPLSDALLPGIRRDVILNFAKKYGIPFEEKSLRPGDLFQSDEIFITSTLKDILPICKFEGKVIGTGCPGPLTRRLIAAYQEGISGQDSLI